MTHTYKHLFTSGTIATVTLTLPGTAERMHYAIRWNRQPTESDAAEYGRWRAAIIADVWLLSGRGYRMVDDQPPFRRESVRA